MVFVFVISSPALANGTPASDLHGERWEFQDSTKAKATARAQGKLNETFSLASPERRAVTSLRFVGEYVSRRALEQAEESGVALTAGDADAVVATLLAEDIDAACKRHDFRDGDVCSRCDEMRGVA